MGARSSIHAEPKDASASRFDQGRRTSAAGIGECRLALPVSRVLALRCPREFERVLSSRPLLASKGFALHFLRSMPAPPRQSRDRSTTDKLSTTHAREIHRVVDNRQIDESTPLRQEPVGWWLGLVMPKRLARRSVTRSLLKRQVRQLMAHHLARLPKGMWVVRLRAEFDCSLFLSASSETLRIAVRTELSAMFESPAATTA